MKCFKAFVYEKRVNILHHESVEYEIAK